MSPKTTEKTEDVKTSEPVVIDPAAHAKLGKAFDELAAELAAAKKDLADATDYAKQADEEIETLKDGLDNANEYLAKLEQEIAARPVPVPPGGRQAAPKRVKAPLAPEHRGTKTYVIGPQKHYRGGRMYGQGEQITVTDERPGKDWVLAGSKNAVAPSTPVAPLVEPKAPSRVNDKNVGG